MPKTIAIQGHRVAISKPTSNKLASLKLAYQKKFELNIKLNTVAEFLLTDYDLADLIESKELQKTVTEVVEKAKLKDLGI